MRRTNRGQSSGCSSGEIAYEIIQRVLPSGLTVILAPRRGTSIFSEVFVTRAGGRYETPKTSGIFHFIEHMLSQGTKRRPTALDIAREFDATGGEHNAFTSAETTYIFLSADAAYTDLIHDLLSDRVLNSVFAEEVIEREKGVIVEEIRSGKDDISMILTGLWLKLLYGNQALGRDFIGTIKNIRAMRREHLLDYRNKLYVASNSAVCLAGSIPNPAKAFEDIEKFFGSMSRLAPGLPMVPVVEKQKVPAVLLRFSSLEQDNVFFGVRTYGLLHPDRSVLDVIAVILGGYASSRIFLELRGRGLVYDVGVSDGFYSDVGYLVAYANLKSKNLVDGLRVIMDHYRSIAAGEFSEEEVERAKSYLIGSRKMDLENSCDMAIDLVMQFALRGKVMTSEEEDRQIEAITPADVRRVAQDIFVNEKLNLAIICSPQKNLEEKISKMLTF